MMEETSILPQTTWVKVSSLKYNPKNPRVITDEKFDRLVESIKKFPQMLQLRPIICDAKGMVLGGNMRLKACRKAGLKLVPTIMADQLTPEQQREFIVKDNVSFGEWNWDVLKAEWDESQLAAWGLDFPDGPQGERLPKDDGFVQPEIKTIKTKIQTGDLIEIGPHRLLCGSSTEAADVARLMDGSLADLVVTDPPYNVEYDGGPNGNTIREQTTIANDKMTSGKFKTFLDDFQANYFAVSKDGCAWYVWHASIETVNFANAFRDCGLLLKQYIIWVKNMAALGRQDYQWQHELCLYGWKNGSHYFVAERNHSTVFEERPNTANMSKVALRKMLDQFLADQAETDVWHCDKPVRSDEHPTTKPIPLIGRCIRNSSRKGEIVVDAFLGSGTTMVASHQLQRICLGMEMDPRFCQVAVGRMRKLDPSLEIKLNGEIWHE